MPFVIGLDLGQQHDPTALAGVEQTRDKGGVAHYAARLLKRWHLGTPYPVIVDEVAELVKVPQLAGSLLAVDQTGVGRPVVDMFRVKGLALCPVTITAGQGWSRDPRDWKVAKKELVSVVQVLLQSRRLTIAEALPDCKLLQKELLNFKVKITAAANEVFGSWREGTNDDLVLALAIACFIGEHTFLGGWDATPDRRARSVVSQAPAGIFLHDDLARGRDEGEPPSQAEVYG